MYPTSACHTLDVISIEVHNDTHTHAHSKYMYLHLSAKYRIPDMFFMFRKLTSQKQAMSTPALCDITKCDKPKVYNPQ